MKQSIGKVLVNDITNSSIGEILKELTELGIDSLLQDGIIKDIPLVGTIFNFFKAKDTISNRIFLNKLSKFFTELSEIDEKTKEKFIWKNYSSEEKIQELGDRLILTLEQQNVYEKSELLGKAFRLFILGEITKEDFYDLSDAIEDLKVHYIYHFIEYAFSQKVHMSSDIKNHFMKCGFLNISDNVMKNTNRKAARSFSDTYEITELAKIFVLDVVEIDEIILKQKYIQSIKELTITRYSIESGKKGTILSLEKMEELVMGKTIEELKRSHFHKNLSIIFWNRNNPLEKDMDLNRISENEFYYSTHGN